MNFRARDFGVKKADDATGEVLSLARTLAQVEQRKRENNIFGRTKAAIPSLLNTGSQLLANRNLNRFKQRIDQQQAGRDAGAFDSVFGTDLASKTQGASQSALEDITNEFTPSTKSTTRKNNFGTFSDAAKESGGALGDLLFKRGLSSLNTQTGDIGASTASADGAKQAGQADSNLSGLSDEEKEAGFLKNDDGSFSLGISASGESEDSNLGSSRSPYLGLRRAEDEARIKGADADKKERDNRIQQNLGVGSDPENTGEVLTGIGDDPYVVEKADGESKFLENSTAVNQRRAQYDRFSGATKDKFDQEVSQSDNNSKRLIQIYNDLDELYALAEAQDPNADRLFQRVYRGVQADPNYGALFREGSIESMIANRFTQIDAIALGLARENNGGRPSDKDYDKVRGQLGGAFSTREDLREHGRSAVALFANAALNGSVINRQSAQFNSLAPLVEDFIGVEYVFNQPFRNPIDKEKARISRQRGIGQSPFEDVAPGLRFIRQAREVVNGTGK